MDVLAGYENSQKSRTSGMDLSIDIIPSVLLWRCQCESTVVLADAPFNNSRVNNILRCG